MSIVVDAGLLIFDLDGTLIDSKRDIAKSVNLTFRDLGLPEKPNETIYGYVGNGVRKLILDAVESTDAHLIDRALEIFRGHYLEHLLDETRLYPGIREVLNHYNQMKIALVTNKPHVYAKKILEGLGVDKAFDFIIGSEPDTQLKPHPEMILKTLGVLDTPTSDAVMIGDSLNDIYAARSAGVRSCAVAYGFGNADELLSESPDFFVETGEALMTLFSEGT
ncbi:MAG: HAD-IA family hydrolase [Nitrospira sp.]